MGTPHTVDVCANCREPIIQWDNTGAWEHLGSADANKDKSRAYLTGAKSGNPATICNSPKKKIEQDTVAGRTNANYRTAKKP